MKFLAALVAALVLVAPATARSHKHHTHPCHVGVPVWLCAKRVMRSQYHWYRSEWIALGQLVHRESGWDPCAVYPSQHNCSYAGPNACGIPQAYPCTKTWWGKLGKLWATRYGQVHWMLRYIKTRWGDPINAAYHEAHGGY